MSSQQPAKNFETSDIFRFEVVKNLVPFTFLIFTACASLPPPAEEPEPTPAAASAVASAPSETQSAQADSEKQGKPAADQVAVANTPGATETGSASSFKLPALPPGGSGSAHGAHDSSKHSTMGVAPEKALLWLKNGNSRFLKNIVRKDGQSKKDIQRLSQGQKPHTIVLSCSDSRVPPEIVFDQRLGELFVVRTAGQSLDANVLGSIEYAVEHLGARLIVVMGHTSCGAVKAALATKDGGSAGTNNLDKLVSDIHPRVKAFDAKGSPTLKEESWANAQGVAGDLLSRSSLIKGKVGAGDVLVRTALYDLGSGKVDFQ